MTTIHKDISERLPQFNRSLYLQVKEVLDIVYTAMEEKGYNPVNQIVGYIMSGDPTYITSYKGARSMIMKVERDELVEELLKEYIRNRSWERRRWEFWD